MAVVQLKNITKVYPSAGGKNAGGEVAAVRDFSLDIADKEFVVLVGPSGCGKSTTLRMVAGLEEISGGELFIDGKLMNDVAPKDRDIAMVFQNYALYPHMTVYENMAFSLKLRKLPKAEIDRKVREAAEILEITPYLDRKPKALSGGQCQRAAIGRAIVRSPKVMLMDEPLSNLDAKLRNEMRTEIIKLRERIDTTFIYVTHDQVEAMTLSDRIVVICDGRIRQTGTPQEVFSRPADLFVAGFIGVPAMNFFDAKLIRDGEKYFAELGGFRAELSAEKEKRLRDNGVGSEEVVLGIRPENVFLAGQGVPAIADVVEMMGSSIHLHLVAGNRDVTVVVPIGDLKEPVRRGDPVRFAFSGDTVHLFSKETEKNLEA